MGKGWIGLTQKMGDPSVVPVPALFLCLRRQRKRAGTGTTKPELMLSPLWRAATMRTEGLIVWERPAWPGFSVLKMSDKTQESSVNCPYDSNPPDEMCLRLYPSPPTPSSPPCPTTWWSWPRPGPWSCSQQPILHHFKVLKGDQSVQIELLTDFPERLTQSTLLRNSPFRSVPA